MNGSAAVCTCIHSSRVRGAGGFALSVRCVLPSRQLCSEWPRVGAPGGLAGCAGNAAPSGGAPLPSAPRRQAGRSGACSPQGPAVPCSSQRSVFPALSSLSRARAWHSLCHARGCCTCAAQCQHGHEHDRTCSGRRSTRLGRTMSNSTLVASTSPVASCSPSAPASQHPPPAAAARRPAHTCSARSPCVSTAGGAGDGPSVRRRGPACL